MFPVLLRATFAGPLARLAGDCALKGTRNPMITSTPKTPTTGRLAPGEQFDTDRFYRDPAGGPELARGWIAMQPAGSIKLETTELCCESGVESTCELLRTEWIAKGAWTERHGDSGHDADNFVRFVKLIEAPHDQSVPGRVLGRFWVHLHPRSRKPIWNQATMDPANDDVIDLWPRQWVAQAEWHYRHGRAPERFVVPVAVVAVEEIRAC